MSTSSRGVHANLSDLPTVSVIIPTYNRAHLIRRAIQSVLDQTFQDFEIIVVDDGSIDSTEQVIRGFNDLRIQYIRQEENRGGAAARNIGIDASRGKYVSFLDSDDEWLPRKLELETVILDSNEDFGICSTGHVFVDERTGRRIGRTEPFEKQLIDQIAILRGDCITTNDFTARREAIKSIGGYDAQLPARQDWDIWIRMTAISQGVYMPLHTVTVYVMGHRQISTGLTNKLNGTTALLTKHKHLFSADAVALRRILNSIALMYLLDNNGRKASIYLERAYHLTVSKRKKLKLGLLLTALKTSESIAVHVISRYYRIRHPTSYLLW